MNTADNNKNIIHVFPNGNLLFEGTRYRCALGRSGVKEDKVEGDGATPAGCFPIRRIFYRADILGIQIFRIPSQPIQKGEGWCDDPSDARYNTYIATSYEGGEGFFRDDNVYDIIAVIGYNDAPPVKGKGSAIFMHVAREEYSPTEGCIALSKEDLLSVLLQCNVNTGVCIHLQDKSLSCALHK